MYLKKYTRDEDFVAQHEQRRKVNESSKKKKNTFQLLMNCQLHKATSSMSRQGPWQMFLFQAISSEVSSLTVIWRQYKRMLSNANMRREMTYGRRSWMCQWRNI